MHVCIDSLTFILLLTKVQIIYVSVYWLYTFEDDEYMKYMDVVILFKYFNLKDWNNLQLKSFEIFCCEGILYMYM